MRTNLLLLGLSLVSTACVIEEHGAECGDGTHEEGGVCVPGVVCGDGTHVEDGACVPDALPAPGGYQLRVITDQIPADGHTKFPVLAIGTAADGTPSTAAVVLNTDRAGAGSFVDPAPQLGALGTTAQFVPCNATTPGCLGPVTLTLALAEDPATPVATVEVELVEPEGVGSAAACLVGGNVMYFDGNDYIYSGELTVTAGDWNAQGSETQLSIGVTPTSQDDGLWWDLVFDSSELGIPLAEGVYEMAERWPFQSAERPGMSISGDGRGCNTLTGRFQVHEHVRDDSGVVNATVTFEQHCEGGEAMLSGCVHYER